MEHLIMRLIMRSIREERRCHMVRVQVINEVIDDEASQNS